MKLLIAVVWQSIVLYVAALAGFLVGISVPSLRVFRELGRTVTSVRTYDFDWLIAVLIVYTLLLLAGAARRRVRGMAVSATIALALVLAVVLLFTQLGIKNTPL